MSLEYLLLPQLLAAKEAGAEVIGISAPGRSASTLETAGVRHVSLPGSTRGTNIPGDVRAAIALWRILRRERPNVLHTHNPKPGVYGRIVGRLAGVPVIVNTVHGLYATAEDPLLKRLVVYGLEAVASRFSDAELVQNEEDFVLMRRLRLAPSRRLHHLGNGVDLVRFEPNAVSREDRLKVRRGLGIDDGTVVVGMVGRLVREKGYRELVSAAEVLSPTIAFLVVGGHDPEKADALTGEEVARGAQAGIQFLGHRREVRDLYAAMDIVVLPSYREGVPRALMEAAAMGKPLVATDVRGCRQVVFEGVNGKLIPARDVGSLVGAIRELAASPELRDTLGRASRKVAEDCFDERVIIATVLQSYYPSQVHWLAPRRHARQRDH